VSDDDPIQVTISPARLHAGVAEDIDVRLMNNGPGRCTNIIFSMRLPPGLVPLKGAAKIQRSTLAAGESFSSPLRVKASEPGLYLLTSPSFSYQDHRGRARHVKDFSVGITVEPGRQAAGRPRLSAELLSDKVGLDQWDLLRARVTNTGDADAHEVTVSLTGQGITTEDSRPFAAPPLAPGSSRDLSFHVLAREAGSHVPAHLALSCRGPDGQRHDARRRYSLQVGRDRERETMKILFLGANPLGQSRLRIDEEFREIEQEIQLSRDRDRFQVEAKWAVRSRDISRALVNAKPDLVHFAGHGGGGEESFAAEDASGNAFLVPVAGLVGLFGVLGEELRCVIVNACSTQRLAMELSTALPQAHVIGMREPVGDRSAVLFSVGFYQALTAGKSVEQAFELGRAQMMMAYGDAAAPVLWRAGVLVST
jgi:hypothetical protein